MALCYLAVCAVLFVVPVHTWHDFTNTDFHCWPLTASASDQATWTCAGIAMEWLVAPPTEIKAEEPFSMTYAVVVDEATFWQWAVLQVGKTNIFSQVGISDAGNASAWCRNTVCPTAAASVTQSSCCIWHVNAHSCPLEDTNYCGPWIQPAGEVYTHSDVLWGQLSNETHTNWTSNVGGLYKVGTTQLIAHIKFAGFQMALQVDIKVLPRSQCGNSICETEDGEECSTCPADCGSCPLSVGVIAAIAIVAVLIVGAIVAVFVYFRVKQYRLMWDESWIIPYDEIKPDRKGAAGLLGSAVSLQSSMASQGGLMSNMQAQALTKQIFCKTALYNSQSVGVKHIPKRQFSLTKDVRKEVKQVREMEHPNLARFVGASIEVPNVNIVTEYCPKGSLSDALLNDSIPLNWAFRFSMATDIARGMGYLHSHKIYHGRLKSNNCIIDDRWTVKITDFGVATLRAGEKTDIEEDEDYEEEEMYKKKRAKVYLAPECLSEKNPEATPAADVFAFGVILVEIGTRNDPYQDEDPDMVEEGWKPPLPDFSDEGLEDRCPSKSQYLTLIRECWVDNPSVRPTFDSCKKSLHKMNPNKMSPVDIMMAMMEKYSKHLESLVAERTAEVMIEKEKADRLLYSMIPQAVAEDLKRGKTIKAEQYTGCTIYFSDIVGFTNLSGSSTAMEVVALLNKLYTCFDSIIDNYDVYKVETIGDAYMVVSGVPKVNGIRHAREITHMACDLRDASKVFVIPHKPGEALKIRIGMHSGPVCAGVVGLKMPRYCLFGDTVNTSSRMESNGEAYKIHLSQTTYDLLQQLGGFKFEKRGTIPIKGKGDMTTYWLTERVEMPKKLDLEKDAQRKISNSNDSGYNEEHSHRSKGQGLPKVTEKGETNQGLEMETLPNEPSSSSLDCQPTPRKGWEEMPLVE